MMQKQSLVVDKILPTHGTKLRAEPAVEVSASRHLRGSSTVAVVHDWCPSFRGGERVVSEICNMYKGASIYTLFDFLNDDVKLEYFPASDFQTSIANRLPGVERYYRALFFACPFL